MIDPSCETLLTFAALASRIPSGRKAGRTVAPGAVRRWAIRGVRGVKLERVCVGGQYLTSWEAFRRWCDAVDSAKATEAVEMPEEPTRAARRTTKQAAQAAERAVRSALRLCAVRT